VTVSYQFLLAAIGEKIEERIKEREHQLAALERLLTCGAQPSNDELMIRAKLIGLNGQISKLARALESCAEATNFAIEQRRAQ
jgi:hypothetical protein